jgi:formylglycine-generating enzyme
VGDPGNAADPITGHGAVGCTYQIGKYDVTAAQYCQFLNAVAKTDTYGLYSPGMATGNYAACGITQTGNTGSYGYSVTGNPNFPVNYTSWGDAARFCNWLANGQGGPGTTEMGSYNLNGKTSDADLLTITRNPGATYVIPSENEWYKAAYYKGGANTGYWVFPTQNNGIPSNVLSAAGTNNANFCSAEYTDPTNFLTAVGAFASSPSAYGTFDQGGDLEQWNEAIINGSGRGLRGGWFAFSYVLLGPGWTGFGSPSAEYFTGVGFRVALVPEPASLALLAVGGLLLGRRRRA